jgi:DNA repair exonuclease SbcCD nuclease subunit
MGYGLISDTHNHNWSAFSSTDADGVNSRLRVILNEIERAALETKEAGYDTLVHAGDLFHVRGKIQPSVMNPTLAVFEHIVNKLKLKVIIVPGNHDLEDKETTELSNAVMTLKSLGVQVCNESTLFRLSPDNSLIVIPWMSSVDALKQHIEKFVALSRSQFQREHCDLILHAPIDGVLAGIPAHGLTAEWLAAQGFRRVFAGHYHNHKEFDNGVYSIGATTHQTWGDVDTKAGFLLVGDGSVIFRASHAPQFISLDAETLVPADVPLLVAGHYVRLKAAISKDSQVNALRDELLGYGAAGVIISPVRTGVTQARSGACVSTGTSLNQSIADYIRLKGFEQPEALAQLCEQLLREADALT